MGPYDFCGTSANPDVIGPNNPPPADRCSAGLHAVYSTITQAAPDSSSSGQCAVTKQYSNGLGGNETAPSCAFTTYSESDCSSGYSCFGYPTIINKDCCIGSAFYGIERFYN